MPKNCHATIIPINMNEGLRMNFKYCRAVSSGMNRATTPLPSSGGTGRRLKKNNKRFSEKNILANDAITEYAPPSCAATICVNVIESGAYSTPNKIPIRITKAEIRRRIKFAAGPASDINAERFGYISDHSTL